ncbi:hypothetical protein AGABI1DRAFT_130074 [Agaricus bisporus var. burnettii JB137-S8]|uniref:Uncharacterized protein n=1 Tax=Agaricus bisporus var. burnettii (strain JB137-S8 / ATCC MYA-4627 / FGSC 10392) TaxID=597362 RepID=K5WR08_AGABU|nr:uncharacterized protein AGABI1DRAFT_130074 [Agaricus bisporus var. burnettii JB137-S8]EKM77801.1 hypothetical protein AGABI1DRAFT_130074 [Agaricus bisporus var. burnettii JB137-S8]
MAPPSRTSFYSFSESYYPSTVQFGHDVHQFDDVIDDKMNIDSTTASSSSLYEENIDAPSSSSSSSSSSSTATNFSPSAIRSTNSSTRRTKSSSHTLRYKHSFPHRRRRHLFRRSSIHPQLPHAFAQPSTYRYTPYIPISVTGGGHSDSTEFRGGCMIQAAPLTTTAASLDNDNFGDM